MNDEKSLEILDTVQEVGFILRYFFECQILFSDKCLPFTNIHRIFAL